ncbi:MAG TPA: YHS domain-containing protein, partial [Dokdonella sp.]|nr:YHS domain-containing protein [Dokdonella sp.]
MSHDTHGHPSPAADASAPACCATKKPGAAATHIDPVCGMSVDPATAAHHLQHAGTMHCFCSARCLEKFRADPGKYLQAQKSSETPVTSVGAIYTCPMHPEIRQTGPGI